MITKNHRIFLSKADKTLKKVIEGNKIPTSSVVLDKNIINEVEVP